MSLLELAGAVANAALEPQRVTYGPWLGSMRSIPADQVPREYAADGTDFLYLPRSGRWKRRGGQTIQFDTFGSQAGLLPAKWSSKCRQLDEFVSDEFAGLAPTLIALLTRETISAGLDDGRFSTVYVRDQSGNANYTLGSDYSSSTTYPSPGSVQYYRYTPLWYDSGDGGLSRGITLAPAAVADYPRRFLVSGSRKFLKVGNWWYFPSLLGTPARWNGRRANATTAVVGRLAPTGPIPPCHAGSLAVGSAISDAASFERPDSDVSAGSPAWTGQGTPGGANLFNYVDESTPGDTDYIQTADDTSATTCEIGLSNYGFTPASDDVVTLICRARRTTGSAGLTMNLMQGATLKASKVLSPLSTSFAEFVLTLSPTQISSITDWTNLRVQFFKDATASASRVAVSFAALQHVPASAATTGGWRGADRFYFSVAYRFEDDSIWMPVTPRAPNDILPNGLDLFTVDPGNTAAGYQKIIWSNLPIGPAGTKSRILLRTPKIDITTQSTLELNPFDLRVVWEIKDNATTTYDDFYADDDSLTLDVDELLIRDDHIMAPRARYVFGGDARICHSYGGLNPAAIELAPVGRAADYDLTGDDSTAALYNQNSSYFRVLHQVSGSLKQLTLYKSDGTGAVATKNFDFATYTTLEKLVDAINATAMATDVLQWRAQLTPGTNPQADPATALTPHYRQIASCVTHTNTSLTKAAGGLSKVAVGSRVDKTDVPANTFVTAIVSDTEVTMSQAATGATTSDTGFVFDFGDAPTSGTALDGYQRVIGNCLPGFLYFNKTYLNQFPLDKASIWMTVASPGSIKSAANCFSGKISNKHTPPADAGISMGGAAVRNGFVVPFSRKSGAIRNTRDAGTGIDSDYRLFIVNEHRGCCAPGSICQGVDSAAFFSPEGWIVSDLENEVLISEAVYLHAPSPTGDYSYEAPLAIASTAADTDSAYIHARVMQSRLWVTCRSSGSHPNRQIVYDFSSGTASSGIAAWLRPDGTPWGWSLTLGRSFTAMALGRKSDGEHLYGWNEQNAGSTGDGRIDEFETSDTDNGSAITGSVVLPWERLGSTLMIAAQELVVEHSSPSGSSVFVDFLRSYGAYATVFTPSATIAVVVSRDVKLLPLSARVPTASCYVQWRQTAGGASELRSIELLVKQLPIRGRGPALR